MRGENIVKFVVMALGAAILFSSAGFAQTPVPVQDPSTTINDPARAATTPITARKIILVGDSTVALQGGWGPAFCAFHVAQNIVCLNLARGGRSSFSFRAEGSWDLTQKEIRSGGYKETYVLIQFGHNDQPGKPGRTTDLRAEYPANLARYVEETRAAGAIPVLVTPLTRRIFKNGHLDDSLGPWAEATRKVAADLKVPLVDLYATSTEAVDAMGAAKATEFAPMPPTEKYLEAARRGTTLGLPKAATPSGTPEQIAAEKKKGMSAAELNAAAEPLGTPKPTFDYTHLGPKGAEFFATLVTRELAKAVPSLKPDLLDALTP